MCVAIVAFADFALNARKLCFWYFYKIAYDFPRIRFPNNLFSHFRVRLMLLILFLCVRKYAVEFMRTAAESTKKRQLQPKNAD